MPASSYGPLRERARIALRDSFGVLWDDAGLDSMIDEAQREYAMQSGELTGECRITATGNGVFDTPADFLKPLYFIGSDHLEKPFRSWRSLHDQYPDFRAVTGSALLGIVTGFDSYGKLRLFPRLPAGTDAGTLFYQRCPAAGTPETRNADAILDHLLYQACLVIGNDSASLYYDRFITAARRGSTTPGGMRLGSRFRSGRFF